MQNDRSGDPCPMNGCRLPPARERASSSLGRRRRVERPGPIDGVFGYHLKGS
jgi:hypothetical protein